MKDELVFAISKLFELTSWVFDALIVWTAPGLLFVSALSFIVPELKTISFDGSMNIILYGILWPTVIGLFLNSFALLIFDYIAKKTDFIKKVENEIQEQFVNARLAITENILSFFNEEEKKTLQILSPEEKDAFFASLWQKLRQVTTEDVKRRMNLGFTLTPYVSLFHPNIKKEMKQAISPHLNMHVFSLGIFGMSTLFFLCSIIISLWSQTWVNLLIYSLPAFFVTLLFANMALRFAYMYYAAVYSLYLGIADVSRKNAT